MKLEKVFIKPIVTEKATAFAGRQIYTFQVDIKANKEQIARALERLYKVKVANVKVILRKGKYKKVGKLGKLKKLADKKIALIKVSEGKIDLFPQA